MEANPLAAITGRGDHLDAARKSLEKALETVRRNTRLTGVDREAVDKAIQDALKSLEQARKIGVVRFGDFLNDDGIRVFGEGRTFTIPVPSVPPVAVDEDLSRQLKRLNEQIEKLNRRIEQLEKER
jgi:septal ring factor EnvC (AmiA/AmiB activator)